MWQRSMSRIRDAWIHEPHRTSVPKATKGHRYSRIQLFQCEVCFHCTAPERQLRLIESWMSRQRWQKGWELQLFNRWQTSIESFEHIWNTKRLLISRWNRFVDNNLILSTRSIDWKWHFFSATTVGPSSATSWLVVVGFNCWHWWYQWA